MQKSTFVPSRLIPVALVLATLGLLSGCQTYTQKTAERDSALRSGNIEAAAAQADADGKKHHKGKDGILYRLEQGTILRAAALKAGTSPEIATDLLKRSNEAFDAAEERVNEFEESAKVKVGSETAALLTTQDNLPYRGRAYDKVMLNTYKALNYLQLGDHDSARVELNRAFQRQADAVEENNKRIAAAKEAAEQAAAGKLADPKGNTATYDVDRAKTDTKTSAALEDAITSTFEIAAAQPYADYVNPFSVLIDGIFFSTCGEDASDLEHARKSLERVSNMAPENPFVREDLADVTAGRRPTGVTYVFFETGSSPWRDQIRIDIPLFLLTDKVSYIGAAFPRLKFHDSKLTALAFDTSLGTASPSLVCSIDSVVARDFKNEWPTVITKTLISTGLRATIDAVIQKQAEDKFGFWGKLTTELITGTIQASTNIADTRTWRSLPKEFHYARIATPEDRTLIIKTGEDAQLVKLAPGDVNAVYIKSIAPGTPLLINQFKLK